MNTAERVIKIMDTLASANGLIGVSEISRQLEIGKNNVHRILTALEEEGWVWQDSESKKYSLTGAMARVALKALSKLDIQEVSLPFLHQLQQATRETSALVIREDLERMFIHCIPSNYHVRHVVTLGNRRPLWYGSGGKAILAFMKEDEIEAVLDQFRSSGITELASGQEVTAEALREELSRIREQGYALAAGERNPDACGVSAPIFNHNQEVVGSISVSGPISRFNRDTALQYSALVMEKAKEISITLGAEVD